MCKLWKVLIFHVNEWMNAKMEEMHLHKLTLKMCVERNAARSCHYGIY